MKLLEKISKEKYNDVNFILNFIKNNEKISNEKTEVIRYFHCFWKGKLSDLHYMSLKSLINTHPNVTIILWTPDLFELQSTYSWIKIKKLLKEKIQVYQINKNHFIEANAERLYSKYSILTINKPDIKRYNAEIAYASDIVRFVVLYIYGGVWFDLDILFLRNFDSIKINRYVSQWGTDMCGNAAILRLEKGHDLIDKVINKYEKPFYPTTTFKLENTLDLTILPSTFFDILWRPQDQIPNNLQFNNLDDFFHISEWKMPKELYAYHWHNRWNKNIPNFFK